MNIALILSGGTGTRVGTDIPKQYIDIAERPIISYCIEQLMKHNMIDAIQIVAEPEWHSMVLEKCFADDFNHKFRGFSQPGTNRQLSIYHGLEDIRKYAGENDNVLIHDAARPILSHKMISDCLSAMEGHDGVLPVLPMKDTVYASTDGKIVSSLLNRNELFAGQAPECFKLGKYYDANRQLLPKRIFSINGSTEPAIMAGMDIVMIFGDEQNFKITTKTDLERVRQIMKERKLE